MLTLMWKLKVSGAHKKGIVRTQSPITGSSNLCTKRFISKQCSVLSRIYISNEKLFYDAWESILYFVWYFFFILVILNFILNFSFNVSWKKILSAPLSHLLHWKLKYFEQNIIRGSPFMMGSVHNICMFHQIHFQSSLQNLHFYPSTLPVFFKWIFHFYP